MSKKVKIICGFVLFLFPVCVFALHPKGTPPQGGWNPDSGLTLGIGTGYVKGGDLENGFSPSIEFSLFKKINRPFFIWGTLGANLQTNGSVISGMPYFEGGLNLLFFNVGAGYGLGIGDNIGRHNILIFTGLGFPLYNISRESLFFFQLYYRPHLAIGESPTSHEMGLMIKWLLVFKDKNHKK